MSRLVPPAILAGFAAALLAWCPAASAATATQVTRTIGYSCRGAILRWEKLGDQLLASYQDGHGHRIELWCTRRVFDSRFDLRVVLRPLARGGEPEAPDRLATIGGCFFDNGDNDGPIIVRGPGGGYARVEWITEDPGHRRKYRFNYDFASGLLTVTAKVAGCAPVTKVVAPQASYRELAVVLPHPEGRACAAGDWGNTSASVPGP